MKKMLSLVMLLALAGCSKNTADPKSAITYINVERLCVIEGRR